MLKVIKDDITALNVDAIVNAANSSLLGGGGVDEAIHRKAGPELLKECRLLNGCKTGEAKLTKGYNLPSQYVIHTVGPVWHGGNNNEADLLRNCYLNSLDIAGEKRLKSIAFPCISAGVYRYPAKEAAKIAISTVKEYFKKNDYKCEVVFCCFSDESLNIYKNILKKNVSFF